MALLAEELVEEWLNRQGYFTIRGVHCGVHEMDLLAVKPTSCGLECRHVEVQASVRPISYITRVPREIQRQSGRGATSAKVRDEAELRVGVAEWVEKKFDLPEKRRLRSNLAPGPWSRELVVHRVKHNTELTLIREHDVVVHRLAEIVSALKRKDLVCQGAAGAHFVDLVSIAEGAPIGSTAEKELSR